MVYGNGFVCDGLTGRVDIKWPGCLIGPIATQRGLIYDVETNLMELE